MPRDRRLRPNWVDDQLGCSDVSKVPNKAYQKYSTNKVRRVRSNKHLRVE